MNEPVEKLLRALFCPLFGRQEPYFWAFKLGSRPQLGPAATFSTGSNVFDTASDGRRYTPRFCKSLVKKCMILVCLVRATSEMP